MKIFGLLIFVFILSLSVFSQDAEPNIELPSNFQYKRETGEKSGLPSFYVVPSNESMASDAGRGNTFEALGAMIQPERDVYGLMFLNAKTTYQFSTNRNKSCTVTADGEKFEYHRFMQGPKQVVGRLKFESVNIAIDKKAFEKITYADDVTIRCGVVLYNLDADNIDALKYLANEAEADLERRNIKLPK